MGKKRVIKQTTEEAIQEADVLKSTQKQAQESAGAKRVATKSGRIYVSASFNNVRVSATDDNGNMLAWSTSGQLKFKGPKKATPFAASQVTENLLQKISKTGISDFKVFVRGVGGGRESALRTLVAKNVNISSLQDKTPIRHGGCRPPRQRRV